jgi:hypothetical protein
MQEKRPVVENTNNVVAIAPMSDEDALAWIAAQDCGRTALPATQLAQRFGWSYQRTNRRISAWKKAKLIRRRGKAIIIRSENPQPVETTPENTTALPSAMAASATLPISAVIRTSVTQKIAHAVTQPGTRSVVATDVLAVSSALALTGVSAYLSVRGLAVLFPGISTLILGASMECGKLATVAWLARHWRESTLIVRTVLATLVLIIGGINGTGVYSQLIALHLGERGTIQAVADVARESVDARVAAQAHVVEDLDRRIGLGDRAIEEAAKRGRTKTALEAIDSQRRGRAALQDERKREAAALVALQTERAQAAAHGRQVETEAAPIQYVAALFGVTDPETAIRWLVLFMTLAVDPLAIALTWSVAARRRNSGP